MANLVVRDLDQRLVDALKQRAARHGRSAEGEHRAILEEVLLTRPKMPAVVTPVREDTASLTLEQAREEASRCFNCGCVATSPSDLAPALMALNATIRTTKRAIPAEKFFRVGVMKSTILDDGEIVTSIEIPELKGGSKQVFLKFSPRRTIDFPSGSVAVVLAMEAGKVREARIALAGVAPVGFVDFQLLPHGLVKAGGKSSLLVAERRTANQFDSLGVRGRCGHGRGVP